MLLIGRENEIQLLGGLVARTGDGGGATVVCGEAGIGKSALLTEAGRLAGGRGMRVLATGGVQSEAQLAFAGLYRLLRPVIDHADRLPRPQQDAVHTAFGLSPTGTPAESPAGSTEPELFLVALATLGLLAEAAAHRPLLVLVEDAQWLDRASADVLVFVARRLEFEPVLLLAALRDGFPGPFTGSGLPELALTRLDRSAAERVVDDRSPGLPPETRERVLREAAGNPLALVELPAGLGAGTSADPAAGLPLTARLERAFADRMTALPPATRDMLLVAALNDSESLAETMTAAGLMTGQDRTADDLEPAVTARLVEVDGEQVRFLHPLMRSAVHGRAGVGLRRRTHAALALVVEFEDRRVWHRAAATDRPDEAVATELEVAAGRAQRRGGVAAAAAAMERAARLSADPDRRGERLLRAAELAFELGQSETVTRLLAETDRAGLLSERQQWRIAWIRDSFDDGVLGRTRAAWSLARIAERAAADDPHLALNLLYGAALRCWWTEPGVEARQSVVAAAERVPVDGDDPRLLMVLAFASPIEHGRIVLDALRRQSSHSGRAARMLGNAAHAVGAFDLAAGFFAGSLAGLRAQGRLALLARALTLHARSCAQLVDLGVAIPAADEAYRLARDTSQPLVAATAQTARATLAALRGEQDEAYRLAAEAERAALPGAAHAVLAAVQIARGSAALADGRNEDALDELQRVFDPADPAYHRAIRCNAVGDLAEAAVRSGRPESVSGVIAEMTAVGRRTPSPALHSGLRHARAMLTGDFGEALAAGSWPFPGARAQLGYGEWLRRQRRPAESRAPLRAARDSFDAMGLTPWGDRARAELRAAGETSRGRAPDARDRLTPQELQIAQMAAEGLTNREIGQRLYLSHRTVSTHLHRIFPKLGVTSRADLRDTVI
ncbi:ATP-binding protein [Actinoplanes couchii]|uniref:LuxR family transcriptional regulator n=1 Tax=Actinoplanes couchii TaxID=403638 RepID=A0ABQ3X7U8_9ACTN|nr:AAA family ATPase [Actinoplanes couchii]MDR6320393.1 DNA-binding CsgD family transcriptional regulator/tetratricopeptide (TPR) repeat protein [Actinoplanes couchii]GID54595.1 LuxR family transcriptional regulator [Actinoplanes couchii]